MITYHRCSGANGEIHPYPSVICSCCHDVTSHTNFDPLQEQQENTFIDMWDFKVFRSPYQHNIYWKNLKLKNPDIEDYDFTNECLVTIQRNTGNWISCTYCKYVCLRDMQWFDLKRIIDAIIERYYAN